MKSHRKSRNAVDRMAAGHIAARGHASLARGRLYELDAGLSGRRLRRAAKTGRAQVALPDFLIRRPDGTLAEAKMTVVQDEHTRMVTGWTIS